MVVHQRKLDRRTARAQRGVEVCGVADGIERLRSETREQRMRVGRVRDPKHRAEPSGIAVAQRDARIEDDVDVIVRLPGWGFGECAQAAGHTEMHEQRVGRRAEQQVLAATFERVDLSAGEALRKRRRNRPAQTSVVDVHGGNPASDDDRGEALASGFDFGELRHRNDRRPAGVWGSDAGLLGRRIYPKMIRFRRARRAEANL